MSSTLSPTDFDSLEIQGQYSDINNRWDLPDTDWDNDSSSARLFERSRIKALAGEVPRGPAGRGQWGFWDFVCKNPFFLSWDPPPRETQSTPPNKAPEPTSCSPAAFPLRLRAASCAHPQAPSTARSSLLLLSQAWESILQFCCHFLSPPTLPVLCLPGFPIISHTRSPSPACSFHLLPVALIILCTCSLKQVLSARHRHGPQPTRLALGQLASAPSRPGPAPPSPSPPARASINKPVQRAFRVQQG